MSVKLLTEPLPLFSPDGKCPVGFSDEYFTCGWRGSAVYSESTLHQLAPYIGKIKSSMASALISEFTNERDTVYDPFSGSGTVALESWIAGRNVIATDLSPYAVLLTRAKLFPYRSVDEALADVENLNKVAVGLYSGVDLRRIPRQVRSFFHQKTLRETAAWCQLLKSKRAHFLLACILGILHHQRPGFLSFPSSHTVPYLRVKKFPQSRYPELYSYRSVKDRLERKVIRALKRVPKLDPALIRLCLCRNAARFVPDKRVNAIITSPPYMHQLDYGRDNRLRLWFLGLQDWRKLDERVSLSEEKFLRLIERCLVLWREVLIQRGYCALVLGDSYSASYKMTLPDVVATVATQEIGGYSVVWKHTEQIPDARRVRRGLSGNASETILVLRNDG